MRCIGNEKVIAFSKNIETLLLHCICLSFMFTTLDFTVGYWSLRLIVISFSFILLLYNIQIQSRFIISCFSLLFLTVCLCVVNQHSLHCLLLLSSLLILSRISLKKIVLLNLSYLLSTAFFIIFFSKVGVIQPNYKIIKTGELVDIYCFGNPNRLASFMFAVLLFLSLFLIGKGFYFFGNTIGLAFSFYIYSRTGCRTALVSCAVQTLVYFLILPIKKFKITFFLLKKLASTLPILLLLFSFLLARRSSSGLFLMIDLILGRGAYLKHFVDSYSLAALFVGVNFNTDAPFDNSYLYILFSTNIVLYYAFYRFVSSHINRFSQNAIFAYTPVLIGLFAYGMTESLLGYYSYPAFAFFFVILKAAQEVKS